MRSISYSLIVLSLFYSSCFNNPKENEFPFIYSGNIYLKCSINDTLNANFIFDTGADGLIFDESFSNSNDTLASKFAMALLGYSNQKFNLGGYDYKINENGASVSAIDAKSSLGRYCDGILGWDILKNKMINIDYKNGRIIVYKPNKMILGDEFEKIPLIYKNRRFYFKAKTNLSNGYVIEGNYLLDLGNQGSITFPGGVSRAFNLDYTIKDSQRFIMFNSTLYNDTTTGATFNAENFTIGKLNMKSPLVDYVNNKWGVTGDNVDFIGLVGNSFFEKFDVYIDFSNNMMYLKPNDKFLQTQKIISFGFSFIDRTDICEGAIVRGLYLESKAAKAGIRCGDLITNINGQSVKTFSLGQNIFEDKSKEYEFILKRGDSTFKFKSKPNL